MHRLGNIFVVLETFTGPLDLSPQQLRFIADRHIGMGCDQILQIEPPRDPGNDFYYRFFNANGSEAEQCGNGARCVVRDVRP
jgi:diaminopimelate epimerase